MISFEASWDDGTIEDLRLADLCEKHGIKTTFYWPVDIDGYAASKGLIPLPKEFRQRVTDRFGIGSHTITHALLTRVKPEVAQKEILKSKAILEDLYGMEVSKFCYPRGYANNEIRQMVKEAGYTEARNTLVGNLYPPEDPLWVSPTLHVGCDRNEYAGKSWLDYGISLLERARSLPKEADIRFHIWGHGAEIERNRAWDRLDYFLGQLNDTHS